MLNDKDYAKTAKLNRELFFKISNGTLEVTNNAINFMLFTIKWVAKDGRIYCDKETIRKQLFLQNKTFNRVINELTELKLLSKKDEFFYSHFHVLSNGGKKDPTYVRNINILTSSEFLSLNKTKKRLFLYATSFTSIGTIKSVSVEALYSNKYHSGVSYIESYQELAGILIEFVSKGYLVVFINGKRYDDKSDDFEAQLHTYCGYDCDTRKKRMSKTRKHKIGLKVHERFLNSISPNESSKAEFQYFADKYHIYYEVMRPKTIPLFINIQNQLFNLFETVGVELYRHALVSYFSEEQENVLYHDLMSDENDTKAVNTMMDFYLIKDIEQIITNVLKKEKVESSAEEYFKDNENLEELVRYFIEVSSDDHKIMLEEKLEEFGIDLESLVQSVPQQNFLENHWLLFSEHISAIYGHIEFKAKNISVEYKKNMIRNWASRGVLTRKEMLKQAIENLKDKVLFLRKRDKIVIDSNIEALDKVPACVRYNWLDKRTI
ncbi:hypothetical protein ACWV26_11440 [Rummeliibacillus sp. JY-2-4R]